ncbi:MAG: SUMF1/EgtB/PvdO family nonheme iron enzyme [Blastocatellia bacterium]|nr:SUMF1/EgtB/PvdO family nonheme iron enzyme [Blastocatellia bacterium]
MTDNRGSNRVIRGGSWNNSAVNCRSANRNNADPGNRDDNLGLRLVSTSHRRWSAIHGSRSRA